jgi:hydrogenase maturation protease
VLASVASILILGYGNELRGDDALGPQVARAIAESIVPQADASVRAIALHQLTPELAADLAEVAIALFIDARIPDPPRPTDRAAGVRIEPIAPQTTSTSDWGHHLTPTTLLAIAATLFGHAPEAWLISVPGDCFELSDRLSPAAERGRDRAIAQILAALQHWHDHGVWAWSSADCPPGDGP